MQLILATYNLHKIREYKAILKEMFASLDLYSLRDFPSYESGEEVGATFEENATQKALHAAGQIEGLILADDSGLVVPALGGEPGVYSSRYAGNDASDKDNRQKLLQNLSNLTEKERFGYFECAITLASKKGVIKTAKGACEGTLLLQEKGSGGFGYDSLFVKYDYNKTFGQLEETVKNRVSHRRKALDKLLPTIEALILLEEK